MPLSPTTERRLANSILDNLASAREREAERARKERERVRRAEAKAAKALTANLFAVLDARHVDVLARQGRPKVGSVEWLMVVLDAEQPAAAPAEPTPPQTVGYNEV